MTDVLVEHHWEEPLTDADVHRMIGSAGGCLGIHRVDRNLSLLSADGHELFCHFSAPDAESVRIALHQARSPRGRVWAGTVHDAPGLTAREFARANVFVSRRFEQAVVFDEIQALEGAGASGLSTHPVRLLRMFLSTDHQRSVGLYHAPDAESVRIALRETGIPAERVWAFRQFHT